MTSAQAARTAGLALLLFACSSSDEAETAQPAATAAHGGASAGAGAPAAGQAGKAQAGAAGAAQGSAGKPASAGSGGSAGQGGAGSDAGGAGGAVAGSPASGGAGGQAAGGEAASGQAGAGGIAPVCQPGKQEACACPGTTETGVQVCEPGGQSWGPCTGCPGGGAGGEAGGAGASPTGGAGGASGAGGSPAECTEGQHQGCECPIAGEWALQWCQADGSWGACEGCPDYPVPVEGVDYNLCEDSGLPPGNCFGQDGYYGCVTDFDESSFEVWVTKHCKQQGAPFLCCDVPSACDRVAVNMVEPGVVLTCDEYEAETGVKVSSSPCKTAGKVCSVVRPALSACWTMCGRTIRSARHMGSASARRQARSSSAAKALSQDAATISDRETKMGDLLFIYGLVWTLTLIGVVVGVKRGWKPDHIGIIGALMGPVALLAAAVDRRRACQQCGTKGDADAPFCEWCGFQNGRSPWWEARGRRGPNG